MNYTPYITQNNKYESLSVLQPCEQKRENSSARNCVEKDNFLMIDSQYRTYGSNIDYICTFNGAADYDSNNQNISISGGPFKNVVSIELRGASLPNIPNEHYIVLDIKELNGRMNSNAPYADQSFCILYFDHIDTTTYIKPIKGNEMDNKIVYFDPPLASLSRLTVKFISPNSTPIDEANFRNTLLFNIRTTSF